MWVRVTSHFPLQLITLVPKTANLHWRNSWTNSVNLLTWRSDESVQSDSIILLKPPKLLFLLVFSLGLIIVLLSLLSVLRFFIIKFKEWSTAQLASSTKLLNLPTSLLYYFHQLPINFRTQYWQNSFHLFPSCLWYSSSIPVWVSLSVQFKMIPVCSKNPYAFQHVSHKFPWCCLWDCSSVCLIANGPLSTF